MEWREYKGATKAKMCDLIAHQYKNKHMYDGLGRRGMGANNKPTEAQSNKKGGQQ
jgi:hypothetical protein